MAKVTIQPLDNGPYIIKEEAELLDGEGKTLKTASEFHLCRCGLSKTPPYCDGSHVGKFNSVVRGE